MRRAKRVSLTVVVGRASLLVGKGNAQGSVGDLLAGVVGGDPVVVLANLQGREMRMGIINHAVNGGRGWGVKWLCLHRSFIGGQWLFISQSRCCHAAGSQW